MEAESASAAAASLRVCPAFRMPALPVTFTKVTHERRSNQPRFENLVTE
jgi:hypothetical protein